MGLKKGSKCKRYTKKEDLIIINQIKNCPTNLRNAFSEAQKLLKDRTLRSIHIRWYSVLRKKSTTITCGSSEGFTKNIKNIARNKEGIMPEQNLKHYLFIVKEILELPENEREIIIKLFTLK